MIWGDGRGWPCVAKGEGMAVCRSVCSSDLQKQKKNTHTQNKKDRKEKLEKGECGRKERREECFQLILEEAHFHGVH